MSLCNLLRPETEFGIPGAVVNALPSSKQAGRMSDRRTGPKIRRLDMGRRFLCHSSLQNEDLPRRCLSMGRPVSYLNLQDIVSDTSTKTWIKKSVPVARTSTHSLDGQKNSSKSDHRRILPLFAPFVRGCCREISFFADDNNSRYAPIDRDTAAAAIERGHSSPRDTRRDDVQHELSGDV